MHRQKGVLQLRARNQPQPKPVATMLLLLAVSAAGCASTPSAPQSALGDPNEHGSYVRWITTDMTANAIVAQRTIFPYHFVINSAEFNELGHRDINLLAAHYRLYPGPLNVRQGDESYELYQARVGTVTAAMRQADVKLDQVTLSDAPTGGDGMSSDRVLLHLLKERDQSNEATANTDTPS